MIIFYRTLVILLLLLGNLLSHAQTSRQYTLEQVVDLAKKQSPAALQASTQFKNRYWQYRTFKSNYKPQLALSGILPDFNRSISSITQNDGSQAFKRRSLSSSSLDLSLSQNIGPTGGSIFLGSQLERIDVFEADEGSSYLANPAIIGFHQPLFGFNDLRWDLRIQPLRYEEAMRQYSEDMEEVARTASDLFFNLLLAQISRDIAKKNLANNDTLFKIAEGRYNLGKIAENDLLQMKLSVMKAQNDLAQAELDMQDGMLRLKIYLGLSGKEMIELKEPIYIPDFKVDQDTALVRAKERRQQIIGFERRRLEAERNIAMAKGQTGLNVNITGSYGLTQSAEVFENAYENTLDHQRLRIGFDIPIVDWGRTKSRIRTAVANKELVDIVVDQEEQNFDQEIFLAVSQFRVYREKLRVAIVADTIAQKRYDITVQRYKIGKILITDLNIALNEKDQAKRSYIQSLRDFWNAYYRLRKLTLFDFKDNQEIRYDATAVVSGGP